jgi:hypothetical protein
LIMATRPAFSRSQLEPYPNIFIDERTGMRSLEYLATLREIDAAVNPQPLASTDAHALVGGSVDALRAALASQSRDLSLVRERAVELAADAIRAVKAMGEAGELGQSYVTPSIHRLAALIEDHAPRVRELNFVGDDDPVGRWSREILVAAEKYLAAKPRAFGGSPRARAKRLYRIIALAAHGAAALPAPDHGASD